MSDRDATATGLYAQQQLAPGTLVSGRFRIESVLGVGGMGVVYRAHDTALGVPVALKLLRPELAAREDAFERFRQELLTARQVSSPRVVRIHDLARDGAQWFITMDLIEGESLDRRIDRDGPLPFEEAARIAGQLAEGLAAAHARGVVHRDLKPANVLLDTGGNAYVTDFGVARSLASGGLTQSGAIVGTPDYLSPEQARGGPVDARSDLYALGLILYEMLTGAMPFAGGTVPEILAQRMLRSPPPVTRVRPRTPVWLARLVDRLLRPQPAHRLQSANDVVRAIDRRDVPRDWRPAGRLALALAAIAALALAGAWWWQQRGPSRAAPPVAAVAPLHRLLVVPLRAGEPLDADRRIALDAGLRGALATVPGLVVVDSDRTYQAVRQLDPTGGATVDTRALQRGVGADRALEIRLLGAGSDWRAEGRLLDARGSHALPMGQGRDALAALAALTGSPAFAAALGLPRGTAVPAMLPASDRAIAAYGAGLAAIRRDAPVEAIGHLRAATTAAPDFARGWLALAEAARMAGEQDAAVDALQRGRRAAGDAPAALQRRLAAELALADGDLATAAEQWRAQLRATPGDPRIGLELARAEGAAGDLPAALERLQRLAAQDPDDPRIWFELGKFSILHGQAQRAVDDYLLRALVLYKRSGSRFGEAEAVNALGIGYSRLGQSEDAEEQYRKAIELRRATGNRRGVATSLRNLANVLAQRGLFDEARRDLEQARLLHEALGDQAGLAGVENELGLLAEERGDYAGALSAFRRALSLWQRLGQRPGIAQALNDIGFAQYQLGAYDDAQAYLVQSAEAYAALGDETGRIRTQQNLGQLATARGQWVEARRQLQASLEAAQRQQMFEEVAVARRNLAELELLQGHLDDALSQATQAEALFERREDPRGRVDAALLRLQAAMALDDADRIEAAWNTLSGALAEASAEQRGIAALQRAELARRKGDAGARARALAEAAPLAEASGVRQLQLQVALQKAADGHMGPALDQATAALGNAALRLRWSELAIAQGLRGGDANAAVAHYRDALALLRRGDYLRAAALHALGARAAEAAGDRFLAATAREQSVAAQAMLDRHRPRPPAAAAVAGGPD